MRQVDPIPSNVARCGGDFRSLAFLLPQFHPIPENDEWWGTGFTEWTNVTRARPLFPGHYQPHLPADLGFYDLRLQQAREAQAELARAHGVHGFVYYHYWFSGRRVLEHPLQEVLRLGEPDFPFCVAWANESWTRTWDGGSSDVLLKQEYSVEDDVAHIRALRPALTDSRYICVRDRPVLLIYRASALTDARATTDRWRQEAERWGLPGLYLLRIESFPSEAGDPRDAGFDAAVEFQPRHWDLPPESSMYRAARRMMRGKRLFSNTVVSYGSIVDREMQRPLPAYPRWPGVTPMWDNSPRRRTNALIVTDSTPDMYARWLEAAVRRSLTVAATADLSGEALVFVNAWNEWAEGNHLEPDQRHGLAYLEHHKSTVETLRRELLRTGRG
jgi:lipopolysaccharide biosynthesis protein